METNRKDIGKQKLQKKPRNSNLELDKCDTQEVRDIMEAAQSSVHLVKQGSLAMPVLSHVPRPRLASLPRSTTFVIDLSSRQSLNVHRQKSSSSN